MAAGLGLALAALASGGRRAALVTPALLLAAFVLGVGWTAHRHRAFPAGGLFALLPEPGEGTGAAMRVRGVVLDAPVRVERPPGILALPTGEPGWRWTLLVREVEVDGAWRATAGRVTVFVEGADAGARAGAAVRVLGRGERPPRAMNPGEFDTRRWSIDRGIVGRLSVADGSLVEVDGDAGWRGALAGARAWVRDRAERAVASATAHGEDVPPDAPAALLHALLLGGRSPALLESEMAFQRLGLTHVLAISGFHLVVMSWLALSCVRLLGDHGRLEPIAVGALVMLYLMAIPSEAPVWRAGVTVLVLLGASALQRRYDALTLLAWVALAMLVWRPADLFTLGYRLSFGLTALLLWAGRGAEGRLFGLRLRGTLDGRGWALLPWVLSLGRGMVATSVLCSVVSMPIIAAETGTFSPLAVVSTAVVTPAIVVLLALGYLALGVGMVMPALAEPAAPAVRWLAEGVLSGVLVVDGAWWTSWRVPAVSWAWAWGATMLALYWFARGHARDARAWAGLAVVIVWAWAGWRGVLGWTGIGDAVIRIDTFAVGDGSCHLIRAGDGAVLYDCGSMRRPIGRRLVPDAVRAVGAWRVERVIISHADADHFSALPELVRPLGVREVMLTSAFLDQAAERPSGPAGRLVDVLRERGVTITPIAAGDVVGLGGVRGEVLWPPAGYEAAGADNRASVVMRFAPAVGGAGLLMTGDISGPAIDRVRERHPDLRAAVAEVPHHGSPDPKAIAWLEAMKPAVALQSTGPSRVGDGRWARVRADARWFTTATDGAAWAEIDADGSVRAGSFLGSE